MRELKPADPLISNYPLPMSAKRARFEARRARRQHLTLPKGHPYQRLPWWIPYGLAKAIARLMSGSADHHAGAANREHRSLPSPDPPRSGTPVEIAATTTPDLRRQQKAAVAADDADLIPVIAVARPKRDETQHARAPTGIPFEEAGPGVELRLSVRDLMTLATEFGDDSVQAAMVRCKRLDIAFIARVLEIGGLRGGQRHAIDIGEIDDVPIARMAEVALAALELAVTGNRTRPGGGGLVGVAGSQSSTVRFPEPHRRGDPTGPRSRAASAAAWSALIESGTTALPANIVGPELAAG